MASGGEVEGAMRVGGREVTSEGEEGRSEEGWMGGEMVRARRG